MDKPFDLWNKKKKLINFLAKRPFFYEREIWQCALGCNIGSEQDGKGLMFVRPVIVVRKLSDRLMWIVPLTSKPRFGNQYLRFCFNRFQASTVSLGQLRVIDAERLLRKTGNISFKQLRQIKKHLRQLV